jgi:transcriptional regulator with XRE-family HTH domain
MLEGNKERAEMSSTMTDEESTAGTPYGRKVGERLRAIRRQKRLSLQEVESASEQEFKASVLGAYERGERAISVPRLQRLARFYHVPVDQLLPQDEGPSYSMETGGRREATEAKLAIDLAKLETMGGAEFLMLGRYLRLIQVQRQDFNGRVITIRHDDTKALACILDLVPELVSRRLDELGLRYVAS